MVKDLFYWVYWRQHNPESRVAQEIELLKTVCQKLNQIGIPYMLTGSLAAHFYAVPRMTRDIDIVLEILNPETEKFLKIFQSDFYVNKETIKEAIKHEGIFNIIHEYSCFKIDFIVRKNSPYRSEEFQRKRQVELDGIQIWIVSPEDLIISKLDWAKDSFSTMQINDIKNLMTSVENLDIKYIDKWIHLLKIEEIYKKISSGP